MVFIHDFSNRKWGDARRDENLCRFAESLGVREAGFVWPRQVHGGEIAQVGRDDIGKTIPGVDGSITREKGVFLVILTADCLPILFVDPKNTVAGVVHAGWRSTAEGISRRMVEEFIRLGSNPKNLKVLFGPCICWKHYEVGEDGITCYNKKIVRGVRFVRKGRRTFLDLRTTNRNQLLETGVPEKNLKINPICTFEDLGFYSWRREKPNLSGNFAAVIGLT